jgi:amylosucrase
LLAVYGSRYDFFYHLERSLVVAAGTWRDRPAELRRLDAAREADPNWFASNRIMGGVAYVDLFAGNLGGIRERIPTFRSSG